MVAPVFQTTKEDLQIEKRDVQIEINKLKMERELLERKRDASVNKEKSINEQAEEFLADIKEEVEFIHFGELKDITIELEEKKKELNNTTNKQKEVVEAGCGQRFK